MRHKKAFFKEMALAILALILVSVLFYITVGGLQREGKGFFGFLEGIYKKVMGPKEQETKSDIKECTIKRYYWSANKAKFRDEVNIVIEGQGNCDGKQVEVNTYADLRFSTDPGQKYGPAPTFKNNNIILKWYVYPRSTFMFKGYYFTYKFGNDERRSDNIEIEP